MIKQILRSLGIGCLIAGGILYATDRIPSKEQDTRHELQSVKEELEAVKKELAISQTMTSEQPDESRNADKAPAIAEKPAEEKEPEKDTPKKEEKTPDTETTVITKKISVKSGSNSADLSDMLELAGLIEDASKFDTYMKDYGYAGKIQIGTFTLRSDMSFKEMAEVLTR